MAIPITIKELSYSTAAATVVVNAEERQIAVSLWDLLADGHPASPPELAPRVRVDQAVVDSALERWPGIFRDDQNQVVGFWGLAIPPMAHRFHAEGGKPIHAWRALDPFLIFPVIGRAARVESKDPVSGERIAMTVTPNESPTPHPPPLSCRSWFRTNLSIKRLSRASATSSTSLPALRQPSNGPKGGMESSSSLFRKHSKSAGVPGGSSGTRRRPSRSAGRSRSSPGRRSAPRSADGCRTGG